MKKITEVAKDISLDKRFLTVFGDYAAKISLDALKKKEYRRSKYVLVSGMTPTIFGEGKTFTALSISEAFNYSKKKSICCLRQPSLGPLFGLKGPSLGGGKITLFPPDKISLGLTADSFYINCAHNLIASVLDNWLFRNKVEAQVLFKRAVEVNDRFLREVKIGYGAGNFSFYPRKDNFIITSASEIMAIVSLVKNFSELKKSISRIILAYQKNGKLITPADLGVVDAACALLADTLKPNLVQTVRGNPVFIHTGPFANIAHGNSSVISDLIAFRCADFVVTEAGFGVDCGAEKFFHIKAPRLGRYPNCLVVTASIRALKYQGREYKLTSKYIDPRIFKEDLAALERGFANLRKQIANARLFGVPVVVALNQFSTDKSNEIKLFRRLIKKESVYDYAILHSFKEGARGALELAQKVKSACKQKGKPTPLYKLSDSLEDKIEAVAAKVYGAKKVSYSPKSKEMASFIQKHKLNNLPLCIAKTHLSLSDDPNLKGFPQGFTLKIRDIGIARGAGFIYPLAGKINLLPGLPREPRFVKIKMSDNGKITGL